MLYCVGFGLKMEDLLLELEREIILEDSGDFYASKKPSEDVNHARF